jgi:VCBS repeat-containing protein
MSRLCRLQSFLVATVLSGVFAVPALASPAPAREVVFVDGSVAGHEVLVAGVRPGVETVRLDPALDELAQMAAWAETHSGYEAIHVVSHAAPGALRLGGASLDGAALRDPAVAGQLAQLGRALNRGGDLLLYGCDVAKGEAGAQFVADLAQVTGADVGASINTTGAAAKGGDWTLETATGKIEARPLAMGDFQDVLSTITFTSSDSDLPAASVTRTEAGSQKTITFAAASGQTLMVGNDSVSAFGFSSVQSTGYGSYVKITAPAGYTFDLTSFASTMCNGNLSIALTYGDGRPPASFTHPGFGTTLSTQSGFTTLIADVTAVEISSSGDDVFNDFLITDVKAPPTFSGQYLHSFYDTEVANSFPNVTGMLTATPSSTTNSPIASYGISGGTTGTYDVGGTIYDVFKLGTYGNLYLNSSTGVYVYVPNGAAIEALATRNDEGNISRVTKVESFAVTATDSVSATAENEVSINLTGQNDTPEITSGATASVAENRTGTVYTATASDRDSGQTLAFSLSGTDAALFTIDPSTGAVSFTVKPDFEAPADSDHNNVYDITVTATDNAAIVTGFSDNNDSAPQAVQITVTDDTTAPVVATIARKQAGPVTTANTLVWRVTFAEAVTGVDLADFELTPVDGAATATLGTVTAGANAAEYFVTATGVAGTGTLRLDVKASGTGIVDVEGYALAAGFTQGQSYTHVLGTVPVAWGYNVYGQLGLGAKDSAAHPLAAFVPNTGALAGKTVVAVASGASHTLALDSDGKVYAWGDNSRGRLGIGSTTPSFMPEAVAVNADIGSALSGKTVVAIAAGSGHSLALCDDGTVVAWGYNNNGQVGDGSNTERLLPVAVAAGSGSALYGKTVVAITAGGSHSLALCSDGTVVSWGGNVLGQLGNGTLVASTKPVAVATDGGSALSGKTVTALAAGQNHSLALCREGTVVAWGANASGQLGNGTTTDASKPVAVATGSGSALSGKTLVAIAGGGLHSLALSSDGLVSAWGENGFGRLGDGTTVDATKPVAVATDSAFALSGKTVVAIAAGESHNLALSSDGTLTSWGANTFGRLGDGTTAEAAKPVAVNRSAADGSALAGRVAYLLSPGPMAAHGVVLASPAKAIAVATPAAGTYKAGDTLTFALTPPLPVTVTGTPRLALTIGTETRYATYASGSGSTSLVFTYTVQAADNDTDGIAVVSSIDLNGGTLVESLGLNLDPALPAYTLPVILVDNTAPDSPTITSTAPVGPTTSAAHTLTGTAEAGATVKVYNGASLLGSTTADADGHWSCALTLAEGASTLTVTATDAAGNTSTAATAGTWTIDRIAPAVATIARSQPGPVTIADSLEWRVTFTEAVTGVDLTDFELKSVNGAATATLGAVTPELTKTGVTGVQYLVTATGAAGIGTLRLDVKSSGMGVVDEAGNALAGGFIAGQSYTHALGTVAVGWGRNDFGQLVFAGTANRPSPTSLPKTGALVGKTVVAVAPGLRHSLALCSDGTVAAWGGNSSGELGNTSTTDSATPVPVNIPDTPSLRKVVAVAAGEYFSLALCSDGTVWAWGANYWCQLGDGTTNNRTAPVMVSATGTSALTGKTVVAVAVGESHSLALCSDGTVAAWGNNGSGQLGDGTTTSRSVPVAVVRTGVLAGKTVSAVAAAGYNSLALCSDGTAAAWGNNSSGQFGNGSNDSSDTPVAALGAGVLAGKTVVAIASGAAHSLALCSDGTVAAAGMNSDGQLGDTTTVDRSAPVMVSATGTSALTGKTVVAVAAGARHSFALRSDGTAAAWGWNSDGQLGDGTTTTRTAPVALSGFTVYALGSGVASFHSLALAPSTIIAVATPTAGVYKAGDSLTFMLTTASAVTVSGTPRLALTVGSATRYATFVSGSSSTSLRFSYTVVAGDNDADGIAVASAIELNGGTMIDALGGAIELSLPGYTLPAIKVDATAPETTITAQPASSSASTSAEFTFGSAEAGTSFEASLDGADYATATSPATYTGLADGSHTFSVRAIDAVGNVDASPASYTWTIDTVAPETTITAQPASSSVSTSASFTFSGNDAAGTGVASFEASLDGAAYAATTSPATFAGLAEGAHTFAVRAIDAVGNVDATPATYSWTIDSTPPAVPTITSTAPAGITTNPAYTLTGTAEAGATVKIYNAGSLVGTVTADAEGHWSCALTLADGATALTVTATDAVGNTSVAASDTSWTIDTTAPVVATIARTQTGPVTTANSLVWRVTFSEPVTGVDADDFVVTSLVGGASGTISSVTGSGATYLVTVALTGTGRVRLDLVAAGSGIADAAALPLSANFVRGQVYVASSSALPVSWGYNGYGQLGDGTMDSASAPLPVLHGAIPTNQPVVSVVCGDSHSVALTAGGLVYSWGYNSNGELGNGANATSTLPVAVSALASETVVAVAAGANFSLALTDDGKVYAWGYNLFGQLGIGTNANSNVPVEVSALAGKRVVAISAGGGFALALTGDGAVYAWGQNLFGQLGNGTNVGTVTTPAQVTGFSGRPVVAISCGASHTLALTADGAVYAWGYNYDGQLGNGTTAASNRPVEVTALSGQGVSALQAGTYHSLALTEAGAVYAWGRNNEGQLGDGSQTNRLTPVAIGGLSGRDVIELSTGEVHTLALLADGSALIWGTNEYSVLGDSGVVSPALTPVPVATTNVMVGRTLLALSTDVSRYSVLALASPTQGALSVSPAGGELGAGASIAFTVTFPSAVTVTGSPRLALTLGSATVYATYDAASSTSTNLVFTYTVQAGDTDADGIAVASSIELNGGTITDSSGWFIAPILPAYTLPTIRVDTAAPAPLTALDAVATGAGQIEMTFTAPEDCTVYFTALDASQTAGTAAQIVAGRDAAANPVRHGSLALAAGVPGSYTLKGLAAGTAYTVHATVGDAVGNVAVAPPLMAPATTAASPSLTGLDWSLMTLDAPCGEDPRLAFAPDGTPYVAFQSTVVSGKLLVQRYAGGVWSPVGGTTGLSAGAAYGLQLAFAPDGTPYVAYYDALLADKAVVKRFTGGAWSAVGPDTGLSDGAVTTLSLAFAPDGTPWLAYADSTLSNKAVVRRYGQGAWTAVGSSTGVTDAGATTLDLVFGLDGTAHLAFRNSADSGRPAVWFWSEASAAWLTGDTTASLPAADQVHLAAAPDGTLYLAYRNSSDSTVGVARHDAASWTQIGDSQPASTWLDLAVGADGVPFLCYRKGASGSGYRAYVSTYNGSTWVQSGPYVAAGELSYPSLQIAPDGLPYVVCCDEATGKVVVAKLASAMNTVEVPVHGTYGAGQTLAFTANYTAPVSVTGTPRLPLTIGSTTRYADYTATGSTSTALRFLYTVQAGELDLDGLEVGDALDLSAGTIVEPSGWSARTYMGGVDDCSGLHIDAVAPDTTITSQPANPSASASASFTFSGDDDSGSGVASFEASFDGAAYSTATSPAGLAGLADGSHTFAVRALDAAGNADPTPATYTWTVDTTAPSVPSIQSITTTAIGGTAEPGATVEVYLAGTSLGTTTADADGHWSLAISPLADGDYSLTAQATDAAGNAGAASSAGTYTVDTVSPALTKATLVSNNAVPTLAKAGDVVTLNFKANETLQTPTVTLVGESVTASYDSGTSTWTATHTVAAGDAEGTVTFSIAYRDLAGNAGTTVTTTTDASEVTVDLTGPETTFDGTPGAWSGSLVMFDFIVDSDVVRYEESLDGAAYAPVLLPAFFSDLADGPHTLMARAVDAAGNVDATPAVHTWTVDTLKPVLTSVTLVSGNATPSLAKSGDTITLRFRANEALQTPTVTLAGESVTASYDDVSDHWSATRTIAAGDAEGAVTFSIAYRDLAGNPVTTVTTTTDGSEVTIDLTAPQTTFDGTPGAWAGSSLVMFDFIVDSDVVRYEASLDGAPYVPVLNPAFFSDLADGPHTLMARAIDAAGNVDATPAVHTWTVDTVAPTAPTIGAITPTGVSGTAEAGSTVEVFNGSTSLGTATADASGNWSLTVATLADGAYSLTAKATDVAGNAGTASTAVTRIVDTVVPAVATIARTQPGPVTTADTLVWRVTFTEPVAGVDLTDFELTSVDGAATATLATVTVGTTAAEFLVTATDVSGLGTLRLDVKTGGTGIGDASVGNALAGGFISGQAYTHAAGSVPVAWGWCRDGQLGVGSSATEFNHSPVAVKTTGALAGKTVVALAMGNMYSMALTGDGKAYSWGRGMFGELGNGTIADNTVQEPVPVNQAGALAGKTVIAIAVGHFHSLALTSDGAVYAWGRNDCGQLGNGSYVNSAEPVAVIRSGALAGKTVVAIAANAENSMALTSDGAVYTWGTGSFGRLGNGSLSDSAEPVAVKTVGALAGKTVVGVAMGTMYSLALANDGAVYTWGYGRYGELGNGDSVDSAEPVAVKRAGALAGKTIVAIAAGGGHSLALAGDGSLYTWGSGAFGKLGNGTETDTTEPVAVTMSGALAGKIVVGVATGYNHSLALTSDGLAYAWGYDAFGQLGNGPGYSTAEPMAVDLGVETSALAQRVCLALGSCSAAQHSLALASPLAITSVSLPANGAYKEGAVLTFTVNFAEIQTVDTTGGTPALALTVGTKARTADYAGGSGTTALTFEYTVPANETDTDGIAVAGTSIDLHGGTILPAAQHPVLLTLPHLATAGILIDTTVPDTTIFAKPVDPSTSDTAAFTFTGDGTGSSVASFEAKLDGASFAPAMSPVTYTGLADGAHAFEVRAIDAAGNVDATPASFTWTVDTIVPTVPTIDSVTPTGVSGTAEPGTSVRVYNGATVLGTTTADVDGNWNLALALADGDYSLTATSRDEAGNRTSTAAPTSRTIDTVKPTLTAVTLVSSNATPALAKAGDTVALSFTASETIQAPTVTLVGETVTAAFDSTTGAWLATHTVAASDTEGVALFSITSRDVAGNTGTAVTATTDASEVSIDLTAPETTLTAQPANPSASGTATFAFSGSDASGSGVASFEASLDGGAYAPATSPLNLTGLAEGAHTFAVRALDAAGNVDATPASCTWTFDTTVPAAPTIDAITSTGVSGTAEPGCMVEVFNGSTSLGTVTADASGNWSLVLPLADGAYSLTATTRDAAGNSTSTTAPTTRTVDTVKPTLPVVTLVSDNVHNAALAKAGDTVALSFTASEAIQAPTVTLVGETVTAAFDSTTGAWLATHTVAASDTEGVAIFSIAFRDLAGNTGTAVTATTDSSAVTIDRTAPDTAITTQPASLSTSGTATFAFSGSDASGSGVASFEASLDGGAYAPATSPLNLTGLAEGAHTFAVRALDAAGNVDATPASCTWTFDTTVPAAPTIDAITSTGVSGTAEPGCMVEVFNGSTSLGTVTADASGNWSLVLPLADGAYSLTATTRDAAGNSTSTTAPTTRTVDTVKPTLPVVTLVSDNVHNAALAKAGDTVALSFTASEAIQAPTVTLVGETVTAAFDSTTGAWLATHTVAASDTEGVAIFSIAFRDLAGNTGTAVTATTDSSAVTIDRTAPDTAITTQPASLSTSASATFTFNGTDASGSGVATFEASLDSAAYTPATSPLNLTGLADGSHTFTVRAVDAAGNVDPSPASYTWTVDPTAPATPVVVATTPTSVSGTGEPGSTVRIYDGTTLLGSTTVGADGTWTLSLGVIPGGAHTLTATMSDAAGNTGAGQSFRFASTHSGDSDGDWRISLPELLWMVELFNAADGAQRTGAYHSAPTSAEGFAPGAGPLGYYHSSDTDRNGRLDLPELLRAIELYNAMNGTTRTGAYHIDSGSNDGFAAGAN